MNSAAQVPFHLRPNKYVERRLFIEILEFFDKAFTFGDGVYISMGGRMLEDHRLVHAAFGTQLLVSFDGDEDAVANQMFNRPHRFIDCEHSTAEDLIADIDSYLYMTEGGAAGGAIPVVIWLDYTSPAHRYSQLGELRTLVNRLTSPAIVKVTMNASPHTLSERTQSDSSAELQERRARKLQGQLGEYCPRSIEPSAMTERGLSTALAQAVRIAALDPSRPTTSPTVRPIAAFRYKDFGHQMITLTMAVAMDADWDALLDTGLETWPFYGPDWETVHQLSVPDLTIKEQLKITEYVASNQGPTEEELGFKLSPQGIEQFKAHYLRYPGFISADL